MKKLSSLFIAALMSASMWATEGALSGRFTINANGDRVVFSQGNLQYKDGTGWRFAEHQWDFIGAWNTSDWVDLFGWGTWGEGKNPLNTSTTDGDYSWSTDFNGTLTNAVSTGWYTPSTDIYNYIFNTRSTASGIRYAKAKVNDFEGVILLPDNWNSSIYALNNANSSGASYTSNVISLTDWTNQLEANGAVFIPRASMRDGASAGPGGDGHYWTTTPGYAMHITNSDLSSSYGYCYKYYGFAVRLVRAADPEEPYVLQQDGEGNYLLGNLLDWKAFAELVQTNPTANAKMTADINLGNDQTMIGSLSVPYAGIFDGQGHTLTVAYNQSDIKEGIGPFYVLGAATIQNLHVDGSMLTRCGIGGIAGIVKGNATIQRCWVSATLQSNGYNPNPRGTLGGICSVLEGVDDAHLIIEDCLFDGTIVDNEFCGGFMSHVERASCSVTMRRGLNIGTYPTTTNENGTFIREVLSGVRNLEAGTLFHKKVFGKAQGTQVTDEQLASGAIAYNLQNDRADLVWGQRIGIDAEPVLTNDESYRVYKSKNGGYTNNPEDAYEGLQQDGEGNYLLGCLLDWQEFAELVQTTPTANAKMTADINLDDDQTTIGNPGETTYNYFEGTFDGQGHTLTVHYVKQGDKDIRSPFPNISEATIKNIHITGTIESSTACQPAVIGCVRNGTSTIENVWSSVELTSTKSSWCEASGLVGCVDGYRNGNLVMTDCMISGNIISSGSYEGCFIGYINSGGSATVSNCMSVANFTYSGTSGFQGNYTNCYVKQFPSSIPAVMQVTDAQLADGTTTTALQAGRSEEIWVQDPVTNQPMLKIFATTPIEAITANEDPDHAGIYYSTFYDSAKKYALPNDGTEAYAAEVNGGAMYLHKIAEGNDVLPAGTAVIFKATSGTITLTESDDAPVAISVTNHLHGVDVDTEISSVVTGTCYVLSGGSNGVGFYLYEYPNQLKAHKAYIDLNGGGAAQAPKHLRFVFDSATAIENTDADVKAEKRIENGVLYIIKNGVKYNAQGQTVK